jgi:penicillin-binding protein 2
MAMAYSAIANGGTLYQPQMVKAIIGADGKVVDEIAPVVTERVDVSRTAISFITSALRGVTTDGSGETPFAGFPLDQIPIASKTGSAQVTGSKVSTSWFASFAPANKPRYAVVMMVTQGGTGSKTSGPSVRKIYEELFGVTGTSVNPAQSVLIGGAPLKKLPTVRPDGTPVAPRGKMSGLSSAIGGGG